MHSITHSHSENLPFSPVFGFLFRNPASSSSLTADETAVITVRAKSAKPFDAEIPVVGQRNNQKIDAERLGGEFSASQYAVWHHREIPVFSEIEFFHKPPPKVFLRRVANSSHI